MRVLLVHTLVLTVATSSHNNLKMITHETWPAEHSWKFLGTQKEGPWCQMESKHLIQCPFFEAADLITGSALRAARRLRKGSAGVVVGFYWGGLFFGGLGVVEGIIRLTHGFIMLLITRFFRRFFFFVIFSSFLCWTNHWTCAQVLFSFKRFWVISTNLHSELLDECTLSFPPKTAWKQLTITFH